MSVAGPQHRHHLLLPPQGRLLHLDVILRNSQTELEVSTTSTEIWALLQGSKGDKSVELKTFIMKVKEELGASNFEALDPDNPSFIIVRHPLDRLASAFNDRILNKDTDQARLQIPIIQEPKNTIFTLSVSPQLMYLTSPLPQARQHLTKILRYPAIKGQQLPTFSQFLSYVAGDAASDNSEQGDA